MLTTTSLATSTAYRQSPLAQIVTQIQRHPPPAPSRTSSFLLFCANNWPGSIAFRHIHPPPQSSSPIHRPALRWTDGATRLIHHSSRLRPWHCQPHFTTLFSSLFTHLMSGPPFDSTLSWNRRVLHNRGRISVLAHRQGRFQSAATSPILASQLRLLRREL